jgi:8-oxo-dGTP diphosphatase
MQQENEQAVYTETDSKVGNLARRLRKFFVWSERPLCKHKARVKTKNLLHSQRSQKPTFESVSVYGILFNETRSEVLLIKRRDIPVWVLPGGGLEAGESAEEAVVREVLEETGYHSSIVRKIAEYVPVNKMTKLTHFFECCIVGGAMRTGAETKDVCFFPLNALPDLPPPYEGWIRDAAANHTTVLRKKIEGVSYWVLIKLLLQHPILVGRYLLTKLGIHINR